MKGRELLLGLWESSLRGGVALFGRDRWVHTLAFLVAASLHIPLLILGQREYLKAELVPAAVSPQEASTPEGASQASPQQAQPVTNSQGRPIRFVYVDDVAPPVTPDNPGAAASDRNRIGASPDPRKGDSPDPTALGTSAIRRAGNTTGPPDGRASALTSPSRDTAPPRGRELAPAPQKRPSLAEEVARAAAEAQGPPKSPLGLPPKAEKGLPLGGERDGGVKPSQTPGTPAPVQPSRQGLSAQLQEMSAGALAGGFHNPNASRLNTGDLSFDTAAWDLGPYARKVQERVQSNWRTPEAQTILRQKGWVAIRFYIQKDGRVTDLQVIRPSGIPSYDQSALDALRSSNPLPPLPPEVTASRLSAVFRFFYNTDEGP